MGQIHQNKFATKRIAMSADFAAALDAGADALLAASIFHFGVHRIGDIKQYLDRSGYPVRKVGRR